MVRMFVRHRVADYATWRSVYDGLDQDRQEMGATGHDVYRTLGDENDVTVWHDFTNQQAAESFASSTQLRGAMQRAGVEGKPDIWFTSES
jgi:hypothetical protein